MLYIYAICCLVNQRKQTKVWTHPHEKNVLRCAFFLMITLFLLNKIIVILDITDFGFAM